MYCYRGYQPSEGECEEVVTRPPATFYKVKLFLPFSSFPGQRGFFPSKSSALAGRVNVRKKTFEAIHQVLPSLIPRFLTSYDPLRLFLPFVHPIDSNTFYHLPFSSFFSLLVYDQHVLYCKTP